MRENWINYIVKSVTSKTQTRDVILHAIKNLHQASVEDLAAAANVSPVTVRHHLNTLQADGLITADSVRRKVGRPYFVYSLSEEGIELFPKKYFALSSRLLDELKERFPTEVVAELFRGVVQRILEEHSGEFEHLVGEARLNYLVALLNQEGFMARWEAIENGYRVVEYSCPYLTIGYQHEEICTLDTTLIETIMQTDVEQHSCMLRGDACCHFVISTGRRNADNTAPYSQTILLSEVETP